MTQARPAHGPAVQTHSEAVEQFCRPFAPGAIGFRIMRELEDGTVVVAPYVRAQSVLVRLNSLIPGRWAMGFNTIQLDLNRIGGGARLCLVCRLTVTLPREAGGPDVDAFYEDVGEADATIDHPAKGVYSDARKRAAAVAGIGTYLATAIPETTLPSAGNVIAAVDGRLLLTTTAVARLRARYAAEIARHEVTAEFGEVLPHGEPCDGASDSEPAVPSSDPPSDEPTEPRGTEPVPRHSAAEGSLGGWGGGRPTPPPAPVALVRDGRGASATSRPAQAFRATPTMSADHVEEICREAQDAVVSSSALANIVLEISGRSPVDDQSAAREFDSGLLNRTPDALFVQVLEAVRRRSARSAGSRPSPPAGTVPLDLGALSDERT